MSLRIIQPGLYTLVVDFGRPASRSLGVPVGGAADRFSLSLGNALVGNAPDSAALEINLIGPTVEAGCDLACVVQGAPLSLDSDRQSLEPGTTFTLRAGERLRLGGATHGARAYLCVRGGLQTTPVLGSRSGLDPVTAGMELPCQPGVTAARFVCLDDEGNRTTWAEHTRPQPIRVLPGAQADWFPSPALRAGTPAVFRVSPASNRMGLRLQGPALPWPGRELVSEPVCPGTVQVTRDGQCIILGVDGQTIGGYPKIAQVIAADLDLVGQLRPGDEIVFVPASLSEAEELYRRRQEVLREWLLRLSVSAEFGCGR
jgi:5-oxoprolinase (ATP-hydrolysing) subunit C